jgi:predicted membrane channel-forming protein YqfA (hemolysin III family)
VHLKAEKGRRWLGAAATIAGVVLALELVGLVNRPAAWTIAALALVIALAGLAIPRK